MKLGQKTIGVQSKALELIAMTHKKWIAAALSVPAAFVLFVAAYADDSNAHKGTSYKLLTTITIPDGLVGFDISWVDSKSARYYLADRGTATTPATPGIDVIDTEKDTFLEKIKLSTAPNGVVAIRSGPGNGQGPAGTLVVGGANSTAIFIDAASPHSILADVNTGGAHRADELAYDPLDHIILIANDQDDPPFVTFIDTNNPAHVVGKIDYPQAIFPATPGGMPVNHGIEQPVWNTARKRFYISIPATVTNKNGEIDEIDPKTMMVTRVSPTTCNPAGLFQIPGQHLITSCGDVLDIRTGKVIHTVANVGADEIWFNRGDERVYFGGFQGIKVPVVSAIQPFDLLTTLTVGNSTVTPAHTTHSVAADSENNHIFVPVSHEGVKVYTEDDE
jgi:hypothetical protein